MLTPHTRAVQEDRSILLGVTPCSSTTKLQQLSVILIVLFLLSLGIIDLSQVPHLPVLVPPTPGTSATTMDRITYIPGPPQTFGSRHSSSPLSPGNAAGCFSRWKAGLP